MTFLSRIHTDFLRARITRRGSLVPFEMEHTVERGTHKEYARMKDIDLPKSSEKLNAPYETLLVNRKSPDTFGDLPLSTTQWGELLSVLRRHPDTVRRRYPSGGALFPIETYIFSPGNGDAQGVLHYNPTSHKLEYLWGLPQGFSASDIIVGGDGTYGASVLMFTSVWERSSAKYGDFAYVLALLETGHMSENILLGATALDLAARPFAGFNTELVHTLLDIDPGQEQPVLALALGNKAQ